MAGLDLPVAFIVVESLGEDNFLLGRTFIRYLDVLIDLSEGSIFVRDPARQRNLKRKEIIGSYAQSMKLILDGGTVLKTKDLRSEASFVSAGRTLTLTKDGRVAVPILSPTDRDIYMRPGQKVAYALPAFTELTDVRENTENCSSEQWKACGNAREPIHVKSDTSSDGQESTRSTPSGRSNFPAKAEMDKIDLLPDLEELKDRVTPEQLQRLKAVLEANSTVFARNKADFGRCNLIEHRIDLEDDAVPHHGGARRMAPLKAEKANEEVRHLLSLDVMGPVDLWQRRRAANCGFVVIFFPQC